MAFSNSSDMSTCPGFIFLLVLGTWHVVLTKVSAENDSISSTGPVGSGFGLGEVDNSGKYASALDIEKRGNVELQENPSLSSPERCDRRCSEGETPKTCYYQFTAELYNVLGAACKVCTPNDTNTITSNCQCVLADGVERGLLTINRMLPGPSILVCQGDKVVVDVTNHMPGLQLTIHWHGVHQQGTQYYDGVPFVTQCPVLGGNTFRYQWVAKNAGTHYWHAFTGLEMLNGIHGSIVVRQTRSRDLYSGLYDFDLPTHVVLLSDWMHEYAAERFPGRLVTHTGQDPENILINGKGQFTDPKTGNSTDTALEVFTVNAGRRYRFRFINSFSTDCPAQFSVQGHSLLVIATDGEPVRAVTVNTIISLSGERYDFVIPANQPVGSYWIQVRGLGKCGIKRVQQLGVLRYAGGLNEPRGQTPTYDVGLPQGVVLNPLDAVCNQTRNDAICVSQLKNMKPVDREILQTADFKYYLSLGVLFFRPEELFQPDQYQRYLVTSTGDHIISLVNEISFTFPTSPLTSQYDDISPTQFCNTENKPQSCRRNCMCTQKVNIPVNAIVEIILIDEAQQPNMSYPIHLHGYSFYVFAMGRFPDDQKVSVSKVRALDERGLLPRQFNSPPLKDTIAVPNNGYVVLRFKADNPGMSVILQVGTPADLPPVPQNFPSCSNFVNPIST